ncbi:MAG: FAD-dependent oxidoreductase [Pirellulales bacterium]
MSVSENFALGIEGFRFADLYDVHRLADLHGAFWRFAGSQDPQLADRFSQVGTGSLKEPDEAEVLIAVARQLEAFLIKLFRIESDVDALRRDTEHIQQVFKFKNDFWSHKVLRQIDDAAPVSDGEFQQLESRAVAIVRDSVNGSVDREGDVAAAALWLMESAHRCKENLREGWDWSRVEKCCQAAAGATLSEKIESTLMSLADWGIQLYASPQRRARVAEWLSYVRPHKLDFEHLVEHDRPRAELPELQQACDHHLRHREGFKLTDPRMTRSEYLREIDYCIFCHPRSKDSCSHGFTEKDGSYRKNPLGVPLTGCPLDERISEMHTLRHEGRAIGSLAMIMLDNPMCPGTGHRICNDCMKACIFQKQDPVNIPEAETGVLTDVLNLPYGFEIYSLLTRFNPLNKDLPYALPYNGNPVLVVGLGPAGYTLSHYLANYGFGVVGIDGLKLEPVDDELTGRGREYPRPIRDFGQLKSELDQRHLMGFGGVSEYGITVRWDKNFLAVIYLTLLRRKNLRFYGGTRFGGTFCLEDAWSKGFQHIAIATGAGRPTVIDMKNNLVRGVRKASDFLMALQLTGAFKEATLANLQVRLPAIVLGGGLTAIDTATELMAYYPVQLEKTIRQFESLSEQFGEEIIWKMCDDEEREILTEFLGHAREIRAEREQAAREGREPDLISLCRKWGGVSVCYRKRMIDSPAYRLNHEEVAKALEEGIYFVENMTPVEVHRDAYGAAQALTFQRDGGEHVTLPARSIMVAAGTSPNIVYEKEHPGSFELDAKRHFFRKFRAEAGADGKWQLQPAEPADRHAFFLSANHDGRFVTFYGDNHPNYAGNVVKAMASAKFGAPEVARLFTADIERARKQPADSTKFHQLVKFLDDAFCPRIVKVERLTPTIVEVVVKAHYAADKFEPGQFFRLQNYEAYAPIVDGKKMMLEGLALTGAWVEKDQELLSMIVLEMGVSSRLCSTLRPGEPVVVMGPTGAPTEIPEGETVLLAGGGLGNAVLFSISRALRARGCKVVYFAGYRSKRDLFKQTEIEEGTDQVIWAVDGGEAIDARRPQDRSFVGNIVQAMLSYAKGELGGAPMFPLSTVDRIFAIGSDRMMAAVSQARHAALQPFLKGDHVAIASINSLMQCMMKEVCAQCLQKHVDPVTRQEAGVVFSCFNQDQEMDRVDFGNLRERLKANSLAEKLSNRYLDILLDHGRLERI